MRAGTARERRTMSETTYVYRTTPNGRDIGFDLHTVGFYSPDGEWHPESDHESIEQAAARVHYLNGGKGE